MTDATMTTTTDTPVSAPDSASTPTPLGGAFAVDAGKVQSHLDRVVRETQSTEVIDDQRADQLAGDGWRRRRVWPPSCHV